MKALRIAMLSSVVLLGACSHYSEDLAVLDQNMTKSPNTQMAMAEQNPQDIATAAGGDATALNKDIAAKALSQYLAQEYYVMAKYENDVAYDYKTSKLFTEKAMMAEKGAVVEPSAISSYDISKDDMPALQKSRNDLIAALKNQNTPDNAKTLASAQVGFECWLERTEEAENKNHYASCRGAFEQSMAMLAVPAAGTPEDKISR